MFSCSLAIAIVACIHLVLLNFIGTVNGAPYECVIRTGLV